MLSIIVPVYNTAATLDRCVASVLADAAADTELLLVDDGSPDSAPQLCDRWAARDPRVRVIHRANGGLSAARNTGLDAARGRYVMFVDSDDALAPGTQEAALAAISAAPDCDMAEFPVSFVGGRRDGELLSPAEAEAAVETAVAAAATTAAANAATAANPDRPTVTPDGTLLYRSMRSYWLFGEGYTHSYSCNKIYRRSLFEGVRFPEGRVFEDVATTPRLLCRTRCLAVTPRGRYLYHANAGGITARAGEAEVASLLDASTEAWHMLGLGPVGGTPRTADAPTRAALDRCYMYLLDIQILLLRISRRAPQLPTRRVALGPLLAAALGRGPAASRRQTRPALARVLKALLLRTLGAARACRLLARAVR